MSEPYIKDFMHFAEEAINKIADTLEAQDKDYKFDIDLISSNILSINGDTGTYIINTQRASEEIWLSSPVSGPYHFAYKNDEWVSKTNDKLFDILEQELNMKII